MKLRRFLVVALLLLGAGRVPACLAAPQAMVVAAHPLAVEAGLEVLRRGGSAVDAALAVQMVLGVVEPQSSGLGGGGFLLHFNGATGAMTVYDGRETAPSGATPTMFLDRDGKPLGFREATVSGISVGVPGALAMLELAHKEQGKLAWSELFKPAIEVAREGFAVSPRLAVWLERLPLLRTEPGIAATYFTADGSPKKVGDRVRNPALAETMQLIADQGVQAFYQGAIAAEMVERVRSHVRPGTLSLADLADYRTIKREALCGPYRLWVVCGVPPPSSGGIAILQVLELIEPFDIWRDAPDSLRALHLIAEASRLAFADRDRYVADPAFVPVPVARLLSPAYIAERRRLIDPARALPWDRVPSAGSLTGDTVYVGAVDDAGNAASLIQSLYFGFGAGVVAEETGIVLQNRGAYFSLDPDHPNRLEPGKRPLHTLIASLAFRDGRLWQVMGCMGADGQPQIHLQVYTALIDFGLDIQRAVEAPRWLAGRFALGDARDLLNLEGRFADATVAELARRGHAINRWTAWNELAGHAHGITLDPASGARVGGADPRSDGAAIGY